MKAQRREEIFSTREIQEFFPAERRGHRLTCHADGSGSCRRGVLSIVANKGGGAGACLRESESGWIVAVGQYRNVIIGSGEAGKWMAWTLGAQGERTVVVERGQLGGACPNVACLPSKNEIYSARVQSLIRRAGEFGMDTGALAVKMAGVYERKRKMVEGEARIHRDNFKASGVEVVMGEARFVEARTVAVAIAGGGESLLRGERIFLATGSRAAMPAVPGLKESGAMTHVELLDLERVPEHLVVLGGGYVGLEFAQAMRRFGSRVTIVQRSGRLLPMEDADVSAAIEELMRDEGIAVRAGAELKAVHGKSGEMVKLAIEVAGTREDIQATDILVATGRTPNTDRLDAASGGIELDGRGYIRVNERLETTADGVWAMGDCAGSPQFTHVSFDDYRIVRDNLGGGARTTRDRLIPYCLFTDPEVAHVGLSETGAKAKGIAYRMAKIPMTAILRTHTISEPRGFAKLLVGADDRVLGFTAFGAEASEMMVAAQMAIVGKTPLQALRQAIFTHPTTAEGFQTLLARIPAAG